jgi:protein phosphatase
MSAEEAAETLVDLANLRGGPDNISIIIAHIDGEAPSIPAVEDEREEPPEPGPRFQTAPLWIAAGACLGVLTYCLVNEIWPGALIAAVALAVAFFAALAFRSNAAAASPEVRQLGGPYGNGPYRKADCPPNGRVVASLDEIAGKLRELPEKEPGNWTVNWQTFDDQRAQAAAAAAKGDYVSAIRDYSQAIREIMRQLREHRPTVAGDSNSF